MYQGLTTTAIMKKPTKIRAPATNCDHDINRETRR